ncbi:MAG: TIM-barrel domain-containing protein, partial [Anaerolineae bacterium]
MTWYADGTWAEALGAVRCVREARTGDRTVLEIEAENGRLWVEPLGPAVLRLSARFAGGEASDEAPGSRLLSERSSPAVPFAWEEAGGSIIIRSRQLEVDAERSPLRLRFLSSDGQTLVEEIAGGGFRRGPATRSWHLQARENEAFYGMGYAGAHPDAPRSLNGRGRSWPVLAGARPAAGLPILLSSHRYGLLVDASARGYWDLEAGRPRELAYVSHAPELRVVFFTADTLMELVKTAVMLCGRWPMPPLWSLGVQYLLEDAGDPQVVLEAAQQLRTHDFPCDALALRSGWQEHEGNLRFDPRGWSLAGEILQRLKAQGFHIILGETPHLERESRLFLEAAERGLLVRRPSGDPYTVRDQRGTPLALVDFSHPRARQWWAEEHRPLMELGVDGVEMRDNIPPAALSPEALYFQGTSQQVHNAVPRWALEAAAQGWRAASAGRRPWLASDAPALGMSRWGAAVCDSGQPLNWETLRAVVREAQQMALAGQLWWSAEPSSAPQGAEADAELLIRWVQLGAFLPFFRFPAWVHPSPLWEMDEQVQDILRQYLRLRYRFLPYIYGCFWDSHRTGAPILRPLLLAYEDDEEVRDITDEFLFGPAVLVAPVVEPAARTRRVYLPAGTWYDGWTEQRYEGRQWVEVEALLDRLPMFIRAGALIPFAPYHSFTGERTAPW